MNDKFLKIIAESLNNEEDTIFLTEEEIILESIFFKVSPFVAFSAFKQKAFNSLMKGNAFLKIKKGASKVDPTKIAADIEITGEKLKSKIGSKGKEKDDTVYKFLPEQKKVLGEMYNKYGKDLIVEIQAFRDNVLAPYQLIKRNIKKSRVLTSKEINGMSRDEFMSARESGRKKIERRNSFSDDTKEAENRLKTANETLQKAKDIYESFKNGSSKDISNDAVEKMLKTYGAGTDSLQGYSLAELKSTYEAIVRNKSLIERKIKYDDEERRTDIVDLLKKNRILREKGASALESKDSDKETKDAETQSKKGSFMVAFANYMLRHEIRASFKSDMGGDVYKATYLSILKENIKNLSDRREDALASFVKLKKNIEFNKNEEKVWGKIPTNVQKYSGDIKDYYQKISDEDFKQPTYFQKPPAVVKAENDIETEIKRFERKLAKVVEPEDLAKLKKYRLINNMIVVSELRNPDSLFKSREEIVASTNSKKPDYMDEEEYVRKIKHLVGLKYDTFQELSDAKKEIQELSNGVDQEIADKYNDIIKQFLLKRSLGSESVKGHKYDNAGDVIDVNDIENLVNDILRKVYTDIDQMKQDKMQLDNMLEKYKKEEPQADKELGEIKMLISQVDRKLQGMSIKVIGKARSNDEDEESAGNDTEKKEETNE